MNLQFSKEDETNNYAVQKIGTKGAVDGGTTKLKRGTGNRKVISCSILGKSKRTVSH